ncbi:MAG: hypothetical protein NVSMB63_10630 [Sediminibacterium sp.]
MLAVSSCKNNAKPVADTRFADSLIQHYQESGAEKLLKGDMLFWKNRLDTMPDSYTDQLQYTGDLIQRFHLYGAIDDLLQADSILHTLNSRTGEKEAGVLRMLSAVQVSRHRFKEAEAYVQKALAIGSEKYSSTLLYFDALLETGDYLMAQKALNAAAATNEYGYFFRLSKWKHLKGEYDSAVYYMLKAADWSGSSKNLRQSALSNAADLYMHEGELEKAQSLYVQNLRSNAADYHSLQGVGRIALLHDHDTAAAEKIFRFIGSKTQLPDVLYNMEWLAEQKNDSILQRKAALDFVTKAGDSIYGNMYNKYLIECYTGILASPQQAVFIAEKELNNRSTPQTYAWYVWCLHKANQDAKAMEVYQAHVSGKPLEALELYWMGKIMKDMGKGYNAGEFFKAAEKNRYDLSPQKEKDLQLMLE